MIDLDDFKKVNDTYGHKIGDEVLTGLADFLQVSLHSEEVRYMAGRWGGEEFMIVLPGMHAKDAAVIAEKLRNGFAAIEFKGAGRQTMSLGVTEYIPGVKIRTTFASVWTTRCMRQNAPARTVSC